MIECINDETELSFNSDDDKQTWNKAAYQWRLPYWDWALRPANDGHILPSAFRVQPI